MKLRSFLYLDTDIIDEYYAAINGGLFDEESQLLYSSDRHGIEAGVGVKALNGSGIKTDIKEESIKRFVKNVYASKFDAIYKYLNSDEDENLLYFELLNDKSYESLTRDDYLEVPVKARFSKLKELTDYAKQLGSIVDTFEPLFGQKLFDKDAKESIEGINAISKLTSEKGVACVFEFEDLRFPLVGYLKEEHFRCSQEQFLEEGYLFCKVIRKIPKGKKVELDELFDSVVKFAANREERRKLQKNAKNPDEIRDVIKGPALMVLPIAFYH